MSLFYFLRYGQKDANLQGLMCSGGPKHRGVESCLAYGKNCLIVSHGALGMTLQEVLGMPGARL